MPVRVGEWDKLPITSGLDGSGFVMTLGTAVNSNIDAPATTAITGAYNGETVAPGQTVTLSAAAPSATYTFTSWTLNGVTVADPNAASISFTMPSNDITVTANYTDNYYVAGQARITTNGGDRIWAPADISAPGIFGNSSTLGAGFTLSEIVTPGNGTDGSMCPEGWRLPTSLELSGLINLAVVQYAEFGLPSGGTNYTTFTIYPSYMHVSDYTDPSQSVILPYDGAGWALRWSSTVEGQGFYCLVSDATRGVWLEPIIGLNSWISVRCVR